MTAYTIDPQARQNYKMDWNAAYLEAGETLVSVTVTGRNCEIEVEPDHSAGVVTYWIKNAKHPARVVCHVVTSAGREEDYTDTFTVRNS